jgi:hypothetical protein
MTTPKSNFVFLVLQDSSVIGVLEFMRQTLGGTWSGPPHVTLQGPLPEKVTSERIENIRKILRNDMVLLANPGYFETPGKAVFFYSATSPNMRKVWYKPDYPIEKYGFNPHVTLYEGPEIDRVRRAAEFLRREPVEMICRNFDITAYVSKQQEMFPEQPVEPDEFAIQRLAWIGKIGSSFRARFMAAVNGRASK